MEGLDKVERQAPRRDEDRVTAHSIAHRPAVASDPLSGSALNAAAFLLGDGALRLCQSRARLHLDKTYSAAALRDEVDFARGNGKIAPQNAIAAQNEPEKGDCFSSQAKSPRPVPVARQARHRPLPDNSSARA